MQTARLLIVTLVVLVSVGAFGQSPQIVAQVSLLHQNSQIGKTALFTPITSGVYRVSAYMSTNNVPTTGEWSLHVKWVDDNNSRSTPRYWVFVGVGGGRKYSQDTQVVRAFAGQPISYQVGESGPPDFNYDLFITVEQLESD